MPPEATSTSQTTNSSETSTGAEESTTTQATDALKAPAPMEAYSIESMLKGHGLVAPTEAELMGEEGSRENSAASGSQEPTDTTGKAKEDGDKAPDGKSDAGKGTEGASEPPDGKTGDDKPKEGESTEKAPEKPPKGFVPLGAVHEVRGTLKETRKELQAVKAKLADYESGKVQREAEFKDFKVLSEDELTELTTDNPSEALLYINKLQEYKDFQRNEANRVQQEEADQEALNAIYQRANLAMEEAVPGIFDESGEAMGQMRDFAQSIGFTEEMFYLTDPATRILLRGDDTPYVLGEQAADILNMLVSVQKTINEAKQAANAPAVDEATLRAKITEEVEASLLTKLKANPTFKSITTLPKDTTEEPIESFGNNVSEAEFASWTKDKQDRWLAGA